MKQKNRQLINGLPRRILLMLLDCGLIVFCYYLAILLRFDGEDSIVPAAVLRAEVIRAMAPMLPYVLVIYMVVFWFGGLYEIMWEYAGMRFWVRCSTRRPLQACAFCGALCAPPPACARITAPNKKATPPRGMQPRC